jgi:murein DD-endopeptidase MepM/ murein hydrolase activator NlpD
VSTGGISLPGAAAAALTLTATGAAVIPGLGANSAAATEGHAPVNRANTAQASGANTSTSTLDTLTDTAEIRREQLDALAERSRIRASRELQRQALERAQARAQRWVSPVKDYRFSSPFGYRWGSLHAGDDLAAPIGTRIGSISSGTVVFAGQESGYGNKVEVRHWDGTVSWYGHMSVISVKVGDEVAPGDKLGEVGNTGQSTGPHLHLEMFGADNVRFDGSAWLHARLG